MLQVPQLTVSISGMDSPRPLPLDWRDKLTLGDLEWCGCDGNDAARDQGLDAARAAFLSLLEGNRQKESKRAVDRYWSFVPDGGAVSYKRSIGCFIHTPSQVTVFAYLYEPTVVHAFGRCDCRNSNDNCNHT